MRGPGEPQSHRKNTGHKSEGRPRMKYMDGIKKVVPGGLSAGEILQMSRRRQEWKYMIANVFSDSAHR